MRRASQNLSLPAIHTSKLVLPRRIASVTQGGSSQPGPSRSCGQPTGTDALWWPCHRYRYHRHDRRCRRVPAPRPTDGDATAGQDHAGRRCLRRHVRIATGFAAYVDALPDRLDGGRPDAGMHRMDLTRINRAPTATAPACCLGACHGDLNRPSKGFFRRTTIS